MKILKIAVIATDEKFKEFKQTQHDTVNNIEYIPISPYGGPLVLERLQGRELDGYIVHRQSVGVGYFTAVLQLVKNRIR